MKLDIFYNTDIKESDNYVVIGAKSENSKVDIEIRSPKLPLLLARLAYVFNIYDEELKSDMDFEDFVEVTLKSLRVKPALKEHNTTLEEVSGLLYLIDEATEVNLYVDNVDEEEMLNILRFAKMFSKIKLHTDLDVDFYWID